MTVEDADSEVSDCETTRDVAAACSPLDMSLEKSYVQIKDKIAARNGGSYVWTRQTPSHPDEASAGQRKPVNERVTQLLAPKDFDSSSFASSSTTFSVQERFLAGWKKLPTQRGLQDGNLFTPVQQELLAPLRHQMDVAQLCHGAEREAETRALYCLHALQVAMTARSRVLKHTQARAQDTESSRTDKTRDQGFTRTQTLIVLPFRNSAMDAVSTMAALWRDRTTGGSTVQIENWARFQEEYGRPAEEDETAAEEARRRDRRPASFKHLFRDNIDDCFRIGIKFTRKAMKLFADFYSADIIVASPLGLRLVIDGADKNMKAGGDCDFLSSLELLVIDQTEVIAMQNWEHLERLLESINRIPKKAHGCDFSRIRSVFLDGQARFARQSLVFSRFIFPELNGLLNNPDLFSNCAGVVKTQMRGAVSRDQLKTLAQAPVSPAFFLLPMKSTRTNPADVLTARLSFFTGKVLPALLRLLDGGVLPDGICIFISSYLDFCQVRAHLTKMHADGQLPPFVHLSEYTSNSDISRARAKFYNGLAKIMLVTERFYFFRRYQLRGIRSLIFYSLPDYPEFFTEWIGMVGQCRPAVEDAAPTERKKRLRPAKTGELDIETDDVPVLLAPLDYFKLERIVGTDRARLLLELNAEESAV